MGQMMSAEQATGELFEVRNPRTGEVDYRFHAPSAKALQATLTRLRQAQTVWRDRGVEARVEVMRRWRAEFAQR